MTKHASRESLRRWLLVGSSALAILSACGRDIPTEPSAVSEPLQRAIIASEGSPDSEARADSVAHALALALADTAVRQQLLEDLRDSPFPQHALHLRSYLRGGRGRVVVEAAARATQMTPEAFAAMEERLPELQLLVERPVDRVRWTGGSDIAVYGTTVRRDDRRGVVPTEQGVRPNGDTVTIPISMYASYTYLTLEPMTISFGSDPERTRSGAPHQQRNTITSKNEEFALAAGKQATLSPSLTIIPCDSCIDSGGGGTPDGILLNSLYTNTYCIGTAGQLSTAVDADLDGVRDECEFAFAQSFRPMLAMNSDDRAPEMEPYWAVTKTYGSSYGSTIKIYYALSYYRDPGDPRFSMEAHDGDSEFIIVGISTLGGSRWHLDYVTLSAHWGSGSTYDQTGTYGYASVEYPSEYRGRPRVWVSQDKHANYRSKSVCDGMIQDDCDRLETWTIYRDVDVQQGANLGDVWDFYRGISPYYGALRGCFASRNPAMTGGTECYWYNYGQNYFAGWHGDQGQAKASSYAVTLQYYNF